MSDSQLDIYVLTDEREQKMWQEAVFIFDSSALLNFYFLPKKERTKVFEVFSKKLDKRLWLPAHVIYEFEKNRESTLRKPIVEAYRPLEEEHLKSVRTSISDIEKQIIRLKEKTAKDDWHPYLPQEKIEEFIKAKNNFNTQFEAFAEEVKNDILIAKKEIESVTVADDVYNAIKDQFNHGRYYVFEELMDIVREGELRYRYSIPPGYKDFNKEKKGTQIFGDLIIWKQILEFAKETGLPMVFICDDMKEDWCYKENNQIESPREELIKEIFDFAGVTFWMYNLPQFLYYSNKYLEATIKQDDIDTLSERTMAPEPSIKYKTWGGDPWEARFHKLGYKIEEGVVTSVSAPKFIHRGKDSANEHSDSIINYINDEGEEWVARCGTTWFPDGKVSFTIIQAKRGAPTSIVTDSMRVTDWDGNKWLVTLHEMNLLKNADASILFNYRKIS